MSVIQCKESDVPVFRNQLLDERRLRDSESLCWIRKSIRPSKHFVPFTSHDSTGSWLSCVHQETCNWCMCHCVEAHPILGTEPVRVTQLDKHTIYFRWFGIN